MDEQRPGFVRLSPADRLMPQEEMLEVAKQKGSLTIGVPKEVYLQEKRIPLIPDGVALLMRNGHQVVIETGAGQPGHFSDHDFSEAGARIADSPEEVYKADIILKVAPATSEEIERLKPKQVLISALQISVQKEEYFRSLALKKVTAIAFELIRDQSGALPVTRAMSEIAGSASIFIAAEYLSCSEKGKGKMFGGFTGISPSQVVIIGAGTVGEFAARSALGLGAVVKVFDNSLYRLRRLQNNLGTRVFTSILHPKPLMDEMRSADVLIGAIHSREGRTPCIISAEMVGQMREGSIVIDVSIDQGGCFETSHPTTHNDPVYTVNGVTHYCVPNIPSKVPHTASQALNNIFVPMILDAGVEGGFEKLITRDPGLRQGVYIFNGTATNLFISQRFNLPFQDINLLMAAFHG
jgi:alanine dehydrogenase